MRVVLSAFLLFALSLSAVPAFADHGDNGGHGGGHGGPADHGGDHTAPGGGDHGGHTGGVFRRGRYYGYVKADGRAEKLAVQADFFLESPEDFTQYPRLEAILKLSLGGYHGTEYTSFVYKTLRYKEEDGTLTMDEPSSDLVISAKTHEMDGQVHLHGKFWSRSSATSGVLSMTLDSDEPGDDSQMPDPNAKLPLAPLLDGQYNGKCNGQGSAVFQIQTVRGLNKHDSDGGKDFFDYEIIARIGQPSTRGSALPWHTIGNFADGAYDPFGGKLVFKGPSTTSIQCSRLNDKLTCLHRQMDSTVKCEFTRKGRSLGEPKTATRAFHVGASDEQMKDLPAAGSVSDEKLAELLDGHYTGYLHQEARNLYQPMALHSAASISTENPHNPNKVFVSGTSILYFESPESEQFFSQRYEPRSFYIRPGFALNAPGTDSFLMIEEWKMGYIRGILYSQSYGRVGTVELVKGPFPALSKEARVIPSWQGDFTRTVTAGGYSGRQWFTIIGPNQPAERLTNTLEFTGSFQVLIKVTPIEPIDRGSFDPYTGALGWAFSNRDRGGLSAVSGYLANDGRLMLFWPPTPNVVMTLMRDYEPQAYRNAQSLGLKRK